MSHKILTSWHPVLRWLLLPIACIICPLALSAIAKLLIHLFSFNELGSQVWDGRGYYEIGSFDVYWYEGIRHLLFSAGFILPIIYLAPKYTKTTITIVRSLLLLVFISLFVWFLSLDHDFGFWDIARFTGHFVCNCIGLFVDKFLDFDIRD